MGNFSGHPGRVDAITLLAATALVALAACSDSEAGEPSTRSSSTVTTTPTTTRSPGLEGYTDPGDGCEQAISAIGYADDALRALGQEPYQEFNDLIRSRIGAVGGTLALEAKDWPDETVHRQAVVVQDLAEATAASLPNQSAAAKATRVNQLLRYRIEAGKLVLFCRDAGVK